MDYDREPERYYDWMLWKLRQDRKKPWHFCHGFNIFLKKILSDWDHWGFFLIFFKKTLYISDFIWYNITIIKWGEKYD